MKTNEIASVAIAVIALAGLAVAVNKQSATASVLGNAFGGFAGVIKAAAYGK